MADVLDEEFYSRADEHIHLSNRHLKDLTKGRVSASMMYATARFNAWISASGFTRAEEMQTARDETIDYFVTQYTKMLEDNLDDYISKFESYMRPKSSPE
jgi:hypothetical protein